MSEDDGPFTFWAEDIYRLSIYIYMSKANKGLSTRVLTTFSEVQIFHKKSFS